jgi:hypothetical protein
MEKKKVATGMDEGKAVRKGQGSPFIPRSE